MTAPAEQDAPPPPHSDEEGRHRKAASPCAAPRPAPREASLGEALRTVYRQTIEEDIPAEMLDLLKRLD